MPKIKKIMLVDNDAGEIHFQCPFCMKDAPGQEIRFYTGPNPRGVHSACFLAFIDRSFKAKMGQEEVDEG